MSTGRTGLEIAVVGVAGRFPGARDVGEFWRNLAEGRESIVPFSEEDLREAGVPDELWRRPEYVPARGLLDGVEHFDAAFFGVSAREAAVMDPQHRLFLECAWAALEDAAIDPARFAAAIGLYAGVSLSTYYLRVMQRPDVAAAVGPMQVMIGNDKDYLGTRAAYKLDLRGPAVVVQSACSTSLLAVHLACRSLLGGECDAALAGGASINVPQRVGYLHQEGGILSPDGHCRAFDARARGTVPGSGVGVVVLRRLADALADGDPVRAVILGSAANNDGAVKVGYTAPSVEGQARVIADALAVAGVSPDTVTYVEAHGTGTSLGDPVEVAALTRAFRGGMERTGFCALSSVKTNLGHLDAAAGVAGLIKAVLALEHRQIPPVVHFERPNPELGIERTPFFVADRLLEWETRGDAPRRAGVSSFGIGGTNVHVVMEEASAPVPSSPARRRQVLTLSAKTPAALARSASQLAAHLRANPDLQLGDVAHTLQAGKQAFTHRRAVVAATADETVRALEGDGDGRSFVEAAVPGRPVAFLFPGQGTQHPGMGRGVYESEPVYRAEVDRASEILRPLLGLDLRDLLLGGAPEDAARLAETAITQPALFVVQHALARLWMSWGVRPAAMLGHSIGEYAAACLAGVFSLEDALALVAERGRLMQAQPPGAMTAVPLPEAEVAGMVDGELALAAVNAPSACVVSGPAERIAELEQRLEAEGVACRRLRTSHAFHSAMMDAAVEPFRQAVARVRLSAPAIPFVSNVTGTWITPEQATDPAYWAAHLRATVRFADGAAALLEMRDAALLEVGPGRTLSTLARQARPAADPPVAIPSMRSPADAVADEDVLFGAAGRLWAAGVGVDFDAMAAGEPRRRIHLPTYPFEPERHWIDAPAGQRAAFPMPRVEDGTVASESGAAAGAPVAEEPRRPEILGPYVEPATETERKVAAVWREALGGPPVGARDGFLELGGHSLVGIQVVSRLSRELGVAVPADALFRAPTVAELARLVDGLPRRENGSGAKRHPVTGDGGSHVESGRVPLSFPQERLVRQHLRAPASPANNESYVLGLTGALDVDALRRALAEIVRRHDVFRTTYTEGDGELAATVAPSADVDLPLTDLRSLPADERSAEARQVLRGEAARPFDLAAAPLLRARLVLVDEGEHLLGLVLHQVTSDGWGMGVFFRELGELYGAFSRGEPSPLAEPSARYVDFARAQRNRVASGEMEGALRETAARLRAVDLPSSPPPSTETGGRQELHLPTDEAEALRALGQRHGATAYVTLLATFSAALARHAGRETVVVASPAANRGDGRFDDVVGFFANLLLLPVDVSGDPPFSALLAGVRDGAREAFARAEVPYEAVLEALGMEPAAAPFHATLVMQGGGAGEGAGPQVPGLAARPLGNALDAPKFALALYATEAADGLHLTLRHAAAGWSDESARRLLDGVAALLRTASNDPDLPLSALLPPMDRTDDPHTTPREEASRAALS